MATTKLPPDAWNDALHEIDRILEADGVPLPEPSRPPESPVALGRVIRTDWIEGRHLELIDRELVSAARGELRQQGYIGLLINTPPRHAKSTIINELFPAWYIGNHPDHRILSASYEADFAARWGRRTRDILTEHGKRLWGVTVRDDSSAANRWDIAGRLGGMETAGVGGPMTGKGGNVLILDDYCKNAEEADSETIRQKQWDWWITTFRTRLEPVGFIVVIATRWHEDDLIGRLLQQQKINPKADKWKVIRLPAEAETQAERDAFARQNGQPEGEADPIGREPGKFLWPERVPATEYLPIKSTDARTWFSLYQQTPRVLLGGFFAVEKIRMVDAPPCRIVQSCRAWDLAATVAKGADSLASCLVVLDERGDVGILDNTEDQREPGAVESHIVAAANRDGPTVRVRFEQEPAASGKIVANSLVTALRGYDARPMPATGSKESRAKALASYIYNGRVWMMRASWNERLKDQLRAFPHGAHEHSVDAAAHGFNGLTIVGDTAPAIATASMVKLEPLTNNPDYFLFRCWSVSPKMMAVTFVQCIPENEGDDKNNNRRVHVLHEIHTQSDALVSFLTEIRAETSRRFQQVRRAGYVVDLVGVRKTSGDAWDDSMMSALWANDLEYLPVVIEPEKAALLASETIRTGRVFVSPECAVVAQALTTGFVRDRDGQMVEDGFWEPIARTMLVAFTRFYNLSSSSQAETPQRPPPIEPEYQRKAHRIAACGRGIPGVPLDGGSRHVPSPQAEIDTATCWRPKPIGQAPRKQTGRL